MLRFMTTAASPLRFAFLFAGIFALQFVSFEASRGTSFEKFVIDDLVLTPTAALINHFAPAEDLRVDGRRLVTRNSALRITRGCEGVEMLLLLIAGILDFPASARHRIRGLGGGLILIYILTLTRLALLHFTLRYSPRAWDLLHGLILPLGPVLLVALYFLHWSAADSQPAKSAGTPHAA
jgi:exosortase family protein XrtM